MESRFYLQLTHAVRLAKESSGGLLGLIALSFGYGVFHAAGPGHGKAVLTSYMVSNEVALRRGLVIALLAALLQGFVATAIVGIAALVFDATASTMTAASQAIELASYLGIVALGLVLVWRKTRAFFAGTAAARAGCRPGAGRLQLRTRRCRARQRVPDAGARASHGTCRRRTLRRRRWATRARRRMRLRPHAESRPARRPRLRLEGRRRSPWVTAGARPCSRRDPRPRLRTLAGPPLGRHRLDLRDVARHRDHHRRARRAGRLRQGDGAPRVRRGLAACGAGRPGARARRGACGGWCSASPCSPRRSPACTPDRRAPTFLLPQTKEGSALALRQISAGRRPSRPSPKRAIWAISASARAPAETRTLRPIARTGATRRRLLVTKTSSARSRSAIAQRALERLEPEIVAGCEQGSCARCRAPPPARPAA